MNESRYPEYVKALPKGHPVKDYFDENYYLHEVLIEIVQADPIDDFQKFFNLFNQLSEVEKRYARKENQLFPYLEKYGWNGPSQGMWSFHDANRDLLRLVRKKIEERKLEEIQQDMMIIYSEMQRLMMVEETRLFPYALELLKEDDWKKMKSGDEEIGWMLKQAPSKWTDETPAKEEVLISGKDQLKMDEGYMTIEQINLMLKFMPVDMTYVDENDRVIFYNRGEERVFPRSAGIIGREVRFCHPPKSVGTVLRIVDEFRRGTKDSAEFWIRFRQRIIHIRYFAIRDKDNKYKGVIEMSQDVTEIQKLEGERRLLNWD